MVGDTALITGASGGIGYELAKLFARDGYRLVLVARNRERLEAVAQELRRLGCPEARVMAADLAQPGSPGALLAAVAAAGIEIDVLVNNAGFGGWGAFASTDLTTELEMIQVNITTLTYLTKALLGPMLARGRGRVLNVASTAAFQPGPFVAVYYASKAYVLSLSEAIAEETRGTGITVTTLCPGPTATGFAQRAGLGAMGSFRRGVVMSAARVAEIGYAGLLRGDRVVVTGAVNRTLVQLLRVAPRTLVTRMGRRLHAGRAGVRSGV